MHTRWNIKVSGELDRVLRIHLAMRGLKRGALSSFIEEAVRERLFRQTVEEVKERNAGYASEEVEADVAEAVSEAGVRVVLDTNLLLSSLISRGGVPDRV